MDTLLFPSTYLSLTAQCLPPCYSFMFAIGWFMELLHAALKLVGIQFTPLLSRWEYGHATHEHATTHMICETQPDIGR